MKNSNSHHVGAMGRNGLALPLGRADPYNGIDDEEVGGEDSGRQTDHIKTSKSEDQNFLHVCV